MNQRLPNFKVKMKYFIGLLFFMFCIVGLASAQYKIQPRKLDVLASPSLSGVFSSYQLYSVNTAEIKSYVSKNGKGFSDMEFDFQGLASIKVSLFEQDILTANYTAILGSESGQIKLDRPSCKTYSGMVTDEANSRVHLTISDQNIFGYFQFQGKQYFIEPLKYLVRQADPSIFVVYESASVLPNANLSCGVTEAHKRAEQQGLSRTPGGVQDATGTCRMVEVAIASDKLMLDKYMNVANLQERNIGIMNIMNGLYANAQLGTEYLEFRIAGQYFASSSATNPLRPLYDGTLVSTILTNFASWGQAGNFGFTYDMAQLWSGRDFDGSTIGLAYVSATCTNFRYQILEDYTSSSLSLAVLAAHETGHNLGAQHDASAGFIMAASVSNPPATTFSSLSIAQMTDHLSLAGGACFSSCNTALPVAQFNGSSKNICTGSSITYTDYSVGEVTSRSWSFPDGNPSTSTAVSPVVTYSTPGTKTATLTVANAIGTRSISKEFFVANAPVNACRTSITGNSQTPILYAFRLADINHQNDFYFIGGSNRYEDFTCTKNTRLLEGTTYNVNINVGLLQLPTRNISNKFELFIDYNNDGDFLDTDEAVFRGSNCFQGPNQFSITTPASVPVKNTWLRLRIISVACDLPPTNGCAIYANSQTQDFAVYFPPPPCTISENISGPTNICTVSNNTATYSITATGASNIQWTVPAQSSIISGQGTNSITVLFSNNFVSGDIAVSIDGCGAQPVGRTLSVSKSGNPLVVQNISGLTALCSYLPNSSEMYSIPAVSGANNYQWTITNGFVSSGQGTPAVFVVFTDPNVPATVSVTVSGCGTSDVVRTLSLTPVYSISASASAGGVISLAGVSNNCPGQNRTYTITPNNCFIINDVVVDGISQGPVSSYTFNNIQANHTIVASFTALVPLNAPVVTGFTNVCPYIGNGSQVTYSALSATADQYSWTLPPNVNLVSSSGNSITVTFNAGFATQANKQIRVFASNSCYTSPVTIFYLMVRTPSTPAQIVASSRDVCPSFGTNVPITYTIPKVVGATSYVWTAQSGTTVISHPNGSGVNDTTVSVTFGVGFTSSAITVAAVNECGISGIRSLTITRALPGTPGLISGPTNVCAHISPAGTAATYSIPQQTGVVAYQWTLPAGATGVSGQGTNTISFVYPQGFRNGSISVVASNGCGISSNPRILNIATLSPATPSVMDVIQNNTCPDRLYTYQLVGMPSNATQVQWTVPPTAVLLSGQGTAGILVSYPNEAVSGMVTATAVNSCSNSVSRTLSVKLPACPPEFTRTQLTTDLVTHKYRIASEFEAVLFPNPTTDMVNLTVHGMEKNKMLLIRILDIRGRELQRMSMMPESLRSFGSDLKPGIYFIELTQGASRRTYKLSKL